ncbi:MULTISPECIES: dihydroxyacetone kinase family protein [unclassified Microbacterium]|uniref:dihydroxyacetone kinase family protein n=1 Tax=unclassified Microbacterium TaxID=2609290 RepID=UPI000C2C8E80|nr:MULTISPECIES: dihydroxyacetone kinase family protein [unclassified Microbacterium]
MSPLINDPATFVAESLRGFCSAHADRVAPAPGGVVRRVRRPGKVAIVAGGGSGHYPAFAGWVGRGFVDAAVCGNIFSSPSEKQILDVVRLADEGGGILFVPINYAGDILHFGGAQDKLLMSGVDARTVVVADDIASGTPDAPEGRRGIAGSLIVLKIVGAAAERGGGLDEAERVAKSAVKATRTFGVAFSGCTLPGAPAPLFTVPVGRMAVGMGIHGEPGIAEQDIGTAAEVADVLIDGLLAERPAKVGQRLAVVVNGLGTTKYDELNLVFARVRQRLEEAGMKLVAPLVGEYMTSLDMAGLSVSITYLDTELEDLWLDPVDSVALARPLLDPEAGREPDYPIDQRLDSGVAAGTTESNRSARDIVHRLSTASAAIELAADELGRLDAIAGDGDHGIGMVAGVKGALAAARRAVDAGAGAGTALRLAGERWSAVAGGTSGALWGAGLVAAGAVVGDTEAPSSTTVGAAVSAFAVAIVARGGAEPGDKTMVDAIVPFVATLRERIDEGENVHSAWGAAAAAATRAARDSAALSPRKGRARIHGARSVGTPDAGATSFALLAEAAVSAR